MSAAALFGWVDASRCVFGGCHCGLDISEANPKSTTATLYELCRRTTNHISFRQLFLNGGIDIICIVPITIGFVLDLLLGDPEWLPHPVRLMGRMISSLEPRLRARFAQTEKGELLAGVCLTAIMGLCWLIIPAAILFGAYRIHPVLAYAVESWMCYQILAVTSLRVEAMRVYEALQSGTLAGAREAVARIVGRDTASLDEAGVVRAAVETVAENTGDGIVAPLLFLALGGAPLGFFFKAVSTLDSMVGYQNERYAFFGRASAKLDDVLNFVPARLCGVLMVLAAPLAGLDDRGAWRIFLRDRKKHKSPNSAHPEAAAAGALGIRLVGDAVYGGVVHHKETLGDDTRPACTRDILRMCRLMNRTAILALAVALVLRVTLWG